MAIDDNIIIDRTSEQLINAIDKTNAYAFPQGIGYGDNIAHVGENSVAVGYDCETNIDDVSIGHSSSANASSVAVGKNASAEGGSVAVGLNASAEEIGISIGVNAHSKALSSIQIGGGTNSTQGTLQVWGYTLLGPTGHIPMDRISSAIDTFAFAIGKNAQAQGSGVSVGYAAEANGENAVSIGFQAISQANNAIQIGKGTNSEANTAKIRDTTILDATGKIPFSALQGGEVIGLAVNSNNHLIVTYANGTTADLGAIGGGGGTSDYDDLTNKPQVNGNTLTGNKTSAQLGLQSTLTAGTGIDITNDTISATGGDCKIEILPQEFAQYDGYDITDIIADSTLPRGIFTLPSGGEFTILSTDYNGNTEPHIMTDKSILFFDVSRVCLIGGENPFYYDTNGGGSFVTTSSIEQQLQVDETPTSGSGHLITSGGVYTALSAKQNTLTFDSTPTAQSNNPVTSAGIKTYVDTAIGDIDTALTGLISGGGVQ